jgi:GT2 family glycosyltransferase
MKKISIIIVTYNSIALIKDCIDSILHYNDIPDEKLEVIIVDNSDEKTSVQLFDYVKKEYGERVVLIKNKLNLGYGQGNNVGINAATGELICVMNPDVRFLEPLLLEVQNNFELDSNLCLLGFKQMGGGNISFYMKPECNFGVFTSLIIKAANRFNLFFKNQFHLSGAFMFLDKNKFREVGQFDENFFLYYEEADIAAKIQKGGYDIKYKKDKKYLHLVDDRGFTNQFSLNTGFASLKHYFEKHDFDKNKFYKTKIMDYKFKLFIATILGDTSRVSNIKNEMAMFKEGWFSHFESRAVEENDTVNP